MDRRSRTRKVVAQPTGGARRPLARGIGEHGRWQAIEVPAAPRLLAPRGSALVVQARAAERDLPEGKDQSRHGPIERSVVGDGGTPSPRSRPSELRDGVSNVGRSRWTHVHHDLWGCRRGGVRAIHGAAHATPRTAIADGVTGTRRRWAGAGRHAGRWPGDRERHRGPDPAVGPTADRTDRGHLRRISGGSSYLPAAVPSASE